VSFQMAKPLPAGGTATGGAVLHVFLLILWKLGMKGKTNKKESKFLDFMPELSRFLNEPRYN